MPFILIADDHPITREPLARLFRHEGFEAECAANGVEALAAVRARRPDVVLLDLMMPKMNGLAFLQALRAEVAGRSIPILLMTASIECSDVARARELGVRDVIPKAKFSVDELLRRVRDVIPSRAVQETRPCERSHGCAVAVMPAV